MAVNGAASDAAQRKKVVVVGLGMIGIAFMYVPSQAASSSG
jgi:threonine dehydrogenase-like Zn-dependent dehydrogenase